MWGPSSETPKVEGGCKGYQELPGEEYRGHGGHQQGDPPKVGV